MSSITEDVFILKYDGTDRPELGDPHLGKGKPPRRRSILDVTIGIMGYPWCVKLNKANREEITGIPSHFLTAEKLLNFPGKANGWS